MSEKMELSKCYSIRNYIDDRNNKRIKPIAELFKNRFEERFIIPALDTEKDMRHGFAMMALGCLAIETFQSFAEGIELYQDKKQLGFSKFGISVSIVVGKSVGSSKLFDSFFKSYPAFGLTSSNLRKDFYKYVRCGLLHGAETRGGWKIRRDGVTIYDPKTKTLDAKKFLEEFRGIVDSYSRKIEKAEWESIEVQRLISKFDSIVKKSL